MDIGVTVKTKSVQVMEEIHVEPQQVLETTHVLLGVQSQQLQLHLGLHGIICSSAAIISNCEIIKA